ncbi:MAG: carboxypeptidase regulatory-like domain-containing protein, partial [Planctomycetes bacterium]|nr:carboxypeptidase regulatory-like domain-containing protein [Planctomycetota bacterium]
KGDYEIRGVTEERSGGVRLDAEAVGYARTQLSWPGVVAGEVTPGVDLELEPCAVVLGVILGKGGEPVIGAQVEVRRKADASLPFAMALSRTATTDVAGSFVLDDVRPGSDCFLVAWHSEYLETWSEPFDLTAGVTRGGVRLSMRTGGGVDGIVVDEQGVPVAGARVAIDRDGTGVSRIETLECVATTDTAGRFAISGIRSGRVSIRIEKEGYRVGEVPGIELIDGETVTRLELRLLRGSFVSGHVHESDGAPIAGVTVEVIDTSDGMRRLKAATDDAGAYRIESLGSHPVRIAVEKSGFMPQRRDEVPVNTVDNDFVLRPIL